MKTSSPPSPLEQARLLPKPEPGVNVIPHLPLDLLPQWLEVNGLRGKVEVYMEFGGPLIIKRAPQDTA